MLLLVASIVGTAVASVWLRDEILRLEYETEGFRQTKKGLLQDQRALTVRIEQLRSLERIEAIALGELGMKPPQPGQEIYIAVRNFLEEEDPAPAGVRASEKRPERQDP